MGEKEKCVVLRTKGKSFRDISKTLGIPLSTAHLWAKKIKLSTGQKQYLTDRSIGVLQKARIKAQRIKKINYKNGVKRNYLAGRETIGTDLTQRELTCVAAALYWAEGFKKDSRLGFANSDPEMIRLFLYWLVKVMGVPPNSIRLRVGINIYFKGQIKDIEQYWSEVTKIPISQFQKPFYQNTALKRIYPNHDDYHGVLRIRANGQNDTFRKVLGMIDGLRRISGRISK